MEFFPKNEKDMLTLGERLSPRFKAGDVVFLAGDLGAGKTTLVRGILAGLGWRDAVRSPTFTLLQLYQTDPPALHIDLYRVQSHAGLGIEDYMDTHLLLVEWPDRAAGLITPSDTWQIQIDFAPEGRHVRIAPPNPSSPSGNEDRPVHLRS